MPLTDSSLQEGQATANETISKSLKYWSLRTAKSQKIPKQILSGIVKAQLQTER